MTVLIAGAILQLEQRKRNKREPKKEKNRGSGKVPNPELIQLATLETTSRVLMAAAQKRLIKLISNVSIMEGVMTYVNAEYFWREFI